MLGKGPEAQFQSHVLHYLNKIHGYTLLEAEDITNPELYIAEDLLLAFIRATQAETLGRLQVKIVIYQVNMFEQAEQDIKDIYYYVAYKDSKANALKLIDDLESACLKLENFPERGMVPIELKEIGVIDYLQINCFSYWIICQIEQQQVFIHAVLDGRRDMPALLERRFLS